MVSDDSTSRVMAAKLELAEALEDGMTVGTRGRERTLAGKSLDEDLHDGERVVEDGIGCLREWECDVVLSDEVDVCVSEV